MERQLGGRQGSKSKQPFPAREGGQSRGHRERLGPVPDQDTVWMWPRTLTEIFKGRWIGNREEQHRDHMSLCNLEIKWQMEFHMDKVMHTLNKKNKSQFHLKIDMP